MDTERYGFRYATISDLVERADDFEANPLETYESKIGPGGPILRHLDLPLETLDSILASSTFAVARTDFDLTAAKESIDSRGYRVEREDDDLEIYEYDGGSGPLAVGLTDGTVIGVGNLGIAASGEVVWSGSMPESAVSAVRSVRSAHEGETDRYADENQYVEAIIDRIGDQTAGWGYVDERVEETSIARGQFENERAGGQSIDLDGDTVEITHTVVFEAGEYPPAGDVERWLETENAPLPPYTEDTSIAIDENILTVRGTFETSRLSYLA